MIYVALIGFTLIIVRGTIFRPLQSLWPAFFRCAQCTGMWVGMGAGAIVHGGVLDVIIMGGATSFLALLADATLVRLLGEP